MKVVILTFSYNDWRSAAAVLESVGAELAKAGLQGRTLLVDDASTEEKPTDFPTAAGALQPIQVLRLAQNLGHQRAIAVGLCHLHEQAEFDAVVVMDADGEDQPADVLRLIERAQETQGREVIFAERARRSEGIVFKLFYQIYRTLHVVLTGKGIRFGNFSILSREQVAGLVVEPNLWNHYAAAIVNSRLRRSTIQVARGKRIYGQSRLNFTSLVVHGLSAIACYGEVIGVRVLIAALVFSFLTICGIVATALIRVSTHLAIPGWATSTVGLLLILLLQVLSLAALFTLSLLANRKASSIIPIRDYRFWVRSVT